MTKRIQTISIFIIIVAFTICGCSNKDDEPQVRSWIESEYLYLADSILLQMTDHNDTLAAITLGWRYMQNKDTASAAKLFKEFNKFYDKAEPDLTYLSALSFQGTGQDSLALQYITPLLKKKSYPEAKYLAADSRIELEDYDGAIEIFKTLRKTDKEAIDDSILRCKAEQGDTLSAITFARKMLNMNKINLAVPYYGRYVSLSRGVSPPLWSYEAGKTFFLGNNFTRSSVFLENADADTSFMELSFLLGRSYYSLQVFDSAASKFAQAIEMGDSSSEVINMMLLSHSGADHYEQTLEACRFGISLYPDDDRFYYALAKHYYTSKEYEKLKDLATSGLEHTSSYKLESYNIAAHILLGYEDKVDSLVDKLIFDHRFEAGALSDAVKLFETSLHREDIVTRIKENDLPSKYPSVTNFITWYDRLIQTGYTDSARALLEKWLDQDSVQDRLEFMRDMYQHYYPEE